MSDFREFEKFIRNTKQAQVDYNQFFEQFLLDIALDVLARTKNITPVGETGFLKKSWHLGEIGRVGTSITIELINSMEYASFVENGHFTRNRKSWVDGRFMATVSIEEVESVLEQRYQKAFRTFLSQRGCL